MAEPYYVDADVTLHLGDCLDVLRTLEPDSIDAIVTDPPAGIAFMGRDWDDFRRARSRFVDMLTERMSEALRVLKPGGHALVWSLPRTSHWTAWALEDAGFDIRDCVLHLFGSGFPKSLDVSKAIDKAAGTERAQRNGQGVKQGAVDFRMKNRCPDCDRPYFSGNPCTCPQADQVPVTEDAARWEGWGTALKPGQEMWWLVRKPLAGTVAGNVLEYGTGALNIDGCRVGSGGYDTQGGVRPRDGRRDEYRTGTNTGPHVLADTGRWPANLVLTHSAACEPAGTRQVRGSVCGPQSTPGATGGIYGEWDEEATAGRRGYGTETVEAWACAPDCPVGELDRQSGTLTSGSGDRGATSRYRLMAHYSDRERVTKYSREADSGGASRFYPTFRYQAKAPASERPRLDDGTAHETVKPLGFISWAVRLITPPGGTVLDMFGGSGPVAEACIIEGFRAVIIERERRSADLIRKRLSKPIQPVMFGEML